LGHVYLLVLPDLFTTLAHAGQDASRVRGPQADALD
jgi:hypothetical protein